MSIAIFNTHAFIMKLKEAGMPEKQSEVLVEELNQTLVDGIATKQDIENLRKELHSEIKTIKWGLGIIIVAVAVPFLKNIMATIGG